MGGASTNVPIPSNVPAQYTARPAKVILEIFKDKFAKNHLFPSFFFVSLSRIPM